MITDDVGLIDILEQDLIEKAVQALQSSGVEGKVYGVFSLDDLEAKKEEDLEGLIALGVGYQGAQNITMQDTLETDRADMAFYRFMILLACPTGQYCEVRSPATTVLTALRKGIRKSAVGSVEAPTLPEWQVTARRPAKGSTQRAWQWVQEVPQVEESTETVLYYTQIWRIKLPVV